MKLPLLLIAILLYACESDTGRQTTFEYKPPHVVEAKGYTVPPDKISPPVVVKASNPTTRLAGKPEIVQLHSNEFPAKITLSTPAGVPKLVIPGGEKYQPPQVVAAVDSPYAAGAPEVLTLDVPYENSRGMFSTIKAKHGLHSDEISSMMQDRNGNLWFGQWWGGLARYDGRFLWNYSLMQGLSSDVVNDVFEDRAGNIWIATYNNGVNKFDGKYFTHYSVREGLRDNSVCCVLQDKSGKMWFGTNNGLTEFDGKHFTHYTTAQGLPDNTIKSLMIDSKGQLWAGANGGVTRFDGNYFQSYADALHLNDNIEISCLMEDGGNIWFATTVGLFKYDGKQIHHYTTQGGLRSNVLTRIMKEKNGDIWIGSNGGGAMRYNGKSFFQYGPEQGLPNERVTSFVQDKWGKVWLGTTAGVCKYEGKMFTHTIPSKEAEIEALFADTKGNVWMASGSGSDSSLNRYDGKSMMRYSTKNGLTSTAFNQFYEDKSGNIWFATWNGADRFDGKYISHYSKANGLIDSVVFCITEDAKGNFWFGTNRGLSKFDGKSFTNYSKAQGLISETIFQMLEDHAGHLWIGTNDNGVCRFDGNTFTHFSTASGLSHPMVLGMTEDRNNNLWISTGFGVDKFDGKYFTWYTTDQGLSNNIAKQVVEDMSGNIWVGTINGLNRFVHAKKSNDTFATRESSYFKNYTVADGFTGAGTYENSMSLDRRGNIWIGANDRLTLYHPEGDISDTIAPVLMLTNISFFGENINWQDATRNKDNTFTFRDDRKLASVQFSDLSRWYNQPQNLQLAYNENFITFQFIGITTNRPKEIRYRYLLEGLDETWTSTAQPVAVYNKLPPGKFTLRVQCVNSEGYWSNELHYSFVIFPPWWQTKIAYFVYILALAAAVWLFVWYRSRKLKAENILLEDKITKRTNELQQSLEERYKLSEQIKSQEALLNERLRISRDLHDEIGSTLGSISIYSEVARKRSEKNENPVTVLSKIGVASRELIEKMSDIVWSLNLNHENFEQMQHRMRAFATMMLTPHNITYQFDTDQNSKQTQLSSAQAKNIFLIYKESLYNIVKYAECNNVQIRFCADKNELGMSIHDNGKGFYAGVNVPADERLGGNGIKNMYVRSDEMHAHLVVDSRINGGTTISLRVPV